MEGVSTSFATVTKTATTTATVTATNTIRKTAYTTSTVTATAAAKYTATQLSAIVPLSLLKNATAAYTIVNKAEAATEHYALKCILGLALTAGAALVWQAGRTPPLLAPHGVDRLRWKAIKYRVHSWLHEKFRSSASLRQELEAAKKKLREHETMQRTEADHASQTDTLPVVSQAVQTEAPQQETGTDHVLDGPAPLREEPTETQELVNKLHRALKETTNELRCSNFRVKELQAASKEVEKVADPQVVALKGELEAAQQATQEANAKVLSLKNRMEAANEEIKSAGSGLAMVKDLVRDLQEKKEGADANAASLTMQLEASREEEEKARADLASRERDFHEMRLQTAQQVVLLEEKIKQWEGIAAETKEVNDDIQNALNSENDDLKERLQSEVTHRETLEIEMAKLRSDMNTAKATEMAAPAKKPFTSSETQISPITTLFQNSPSLPPIVSSSPSGHRHLISVAGATTPSTPQPTASAASPMTPSTILTSKSNYTLEHIALTELWNTRKIDLPVYLDGMKALKRKSGDLQETPRPIKKLRLCGEGADFPVGSVLTPGGGPAFKLVKHRLGGDEDDTDDDETASFFSTDAEAHTDETQTADLGLDSVEYSVPSNRDAAKNEAEVSVGVSMNDGDHSKDNDGDERSATSIELPLKPITNIPAIELTPATKRKVSVDDDEGSPKPCQVLRTEEDLGDEQTPGLDEMMTKEIVDASHDANKATEQDDANSSVLSKQEAVEAKTQFSGNTSMDDDDESEKDTPSAKVIGSPTEAHLAPTQAARSKSRLPKPVKPVPTSPRKSARNAGKPAMSLNENLLSKLSASPNKGVKDVVAEPGKAQEKSPVKSRGKSPKKPTAKSPTKQPAKSRASRSPSKLKTAR
jgi:hypothetical protein